MKKTKTNPKPRIKKASGRPKPTAPRAGFKAGGSRYIEKDETE